MEVRFETFIRKSFAGKTGMMILACILTGVISCGRSKGDAIPESMELKGVSIMSDTLVIDYFRPFMVNGNVACTLAQGECAGFVGGIKDTTLYTRSLFLSRGMGPEEYGFAIVAPGNDSTLYVMNSNGGNPESLTVIPVGQDGLRPKDRWSRYRIDSIGSMDVSARAFVPLSDSTILINSARYGSPSVFSIIDYKHPSLTELDWMPEDGFKGENTVKQWVYGVNTQMYRVGDRFLYLNGNSDYSFIFSLKDGGIVIDRIIGDTFPEYEDRGNGMSARCNRKAPLLAGAVSSDRIYILYKTLDKEGNEVAAEGDPSYGRKVVCYDLEGNPLCEMTLDRMGFSIFVDSDNDNLYLCCLSEETKEKDIVRYSLGSLR